MVWTHEKKKYYRNMGKIDLLPFLLKCTNHPWKLLWHNRNHFFIIFNLNKNSIINAIFAKMLKKAAIGLVVVAQIGGICHFTNFFEVKTMSKKSKFYSASFKAVIISWIEMISRMSSGIGRLSPKTLFLIRIV